MLGSIFGAIFTYESWPILRLECGHVSRYSGRPLPGHFAKKSSDFTEINSQSNLLSQKILQKNPQLFPKSTHSPTSSLSSLCKKDPEFFRNTTRHPSLLGLACHSLRGPQWAAQSWFALSIILFQLRTNLLKL